ncbi:MAG TPA: hypothetical protein VGF36_12975 [Rhodopila sp.]
MKRLLALLCGLLTATIVVEVSYGVGRAGPVGPIATEAVHITNAPIGRDTLAARSIAQWEAVSLDRPLFAPDRKPEAGSRSADAGLPRLAGIIAFADEELAIFQPSGNGKAMAVRHGATVGGWEVTMVSAEEVDLRKANSRLVLRPEFSQAHSGGAAKVATQAPSRWEAPAATGVLRARWSNPQLQP